MNVDVDYIHNLGYWDGPLSGLLRARGHYYLFTLKHEPYWHNPENDDDGDYIRIYQVYRLRREIMTQQILRTRDFCHGMGWHQAYRPGENRRNKTDRQRSAPKAPNPNAANPFYNKPKYSPIPEHDLLRGSVVVGTTVWPLARIEYTSADVVLAQWKEDVLRQYPTAVFT